MKKFVPVDPVCGIELSEELAVTHEYDGKKLFFCCNGCRKIFIRKPKNGRKISKLEKIHTYDKILTFLH